MYVIEPMGGLMTEEVIALDAPGNYQLNETYNTIGIGIHGIGCRKSKDPEGNLVVIVQQKRVFEAPIGVLMDSTIGVPETKLREASNAAIELLTRMKEDSLENINKWTPSTASLIYSLVHAMKPMYFFERAVYLRQYEQLRLERRKSDGMVYQLVEPLKVYLRVSKLYELR